MIYASLKPIRQWHTLRVPLAYVVLGHASGAVIVEALVRPGSGATVGRVGRRRAAARRVAR